MPDKVLIIDDDRAISQLSMMWVKAAGYETLVRNDGTSGLEAVPEYEPDVILLDIRMPDIDGFEVFRRLKAMPDHADTPVIFLTASVQEMVKKEAVATGASAFLSKPFDAEKLLQAVRSACEKDLKKSA